MPDWGQLPHALTVKDIPQNRGGFLRCPVKKENELLTIPGTLVDTYPSVNRGNGLEAITQHFLCCPLFCHSTVRHGDLAQMEEKVSFERFSRCCYSEQLSKGQLSKT